MDHKNVDIVKCPKCLRKLVAVTTILDKNNNNPLIKYGYCPNVKCKVKRANYGIIDNSKTILLSFTKFKSLKDKKEYLKKVYLRNKNKYSPKTKKNLYKKLFS